MSNLSVRRAQEGETDYHTLDRYTIAHGVAGLALGLARASLPTMLIAAIGWEIFERFRPDGFGLFQQNTYDTPENAVTDVAAVTLGWAVGRRLTDNYPLTWAKPRIDK